VKVGTNQVAKEGGITSDFANEIIKLFEIYMMNPRRAPSIISLAVFPCLL
jgi:hypothetical protein